MWMPGQPRPKEQQNPLAAAAEETTANYADKQGASETETAATATPITSPPKKLSGATLNMRFMQRKQQQEEKRRHSHEGSIVARAAQQRQQQQAGQASGSVQEQQSQQQQAAQQQQSLYDIATPTDMYGTTLLGRRSFGGFNPLVERAWKEHQFAHKHAAAAAAAAAEGYAISDQELVRRYQEYERSSTSASKRSLVGNLEEKVNKKRRRKAKSLG